MTTTPDPIDVLIGQRISARRVAMKMTQADLGLVIGVSFQQVQKYETAANRVSGSRLVRIARALKAEVSDLVPQDGPADVWAQMRRSFPGIELAELFTTMDPYRQDSLLNVARALKPAPSAPALAAA